MPADQASVVATRYIDIDTLTLVIEMSILGVLKEHEAHGSELKKRMAELAGGSGGVSFGSLSPALTGSSWPAPSARLITPGPGSSAR